MRMGDRFGREVAFTEDLIRQFATYVGDSNPLHHDQAAAAASSFGRLIASGIHTFSMMLAAVPWGLGWLIFGAREFLATDVMLAGIVMIAVIGLALEKLVFQRLEEFTVVRWGMMT